MLYLGLALGAVLGVFLRYGIVSYISDYYSLVFINVVGSFFIGFLYASSLSTVWFQVLALGFLGSFTTFSSFSLDLLSLFEDGNWLFLFIYFISSVTLSFLFCLLGVFLARASFPSV